MGEVDTFSKLFPRPAGTRESLFLANYTIVKVEVAYAYSDPDAESAPRPQFLLSVDKGLSLPQGLHITRFNGVLKVLNTLNMT